MAEQQGVYIWQLPSASTMSDNDKFFIVTGTSAKLITKKELNEALGNLTDEEKHKLNIIIDNGNGTKVLNDRGEYTNIVSLFSNQQFTTNTGGSIELQGYHTHNNYNILNSVSENDEGYLLYNGQILKDYVLPAATDSILGGVKANGTTIKTDSDGTLQLALPVASVNTLGGVKVDGTSIVADSSGVIKSVIPVASASVLGGVKVDNNTIKIDKDIISADVIGEWVQGKSYPVGYFVSHGNGLYRCSVQNNDSAWDETHWTVVAYKVPVAGTWAAETEYIADQMITYENKLYRCNTAHTSAEDFDTEKWDIISGGGIQIWEPETDYKTNDIIMNEVTLYKCISGHTSGKTFDETEQANWKSLTGQRGERGERGISTLVTNEVILSCKVTADAWSEEAPYTQTVTVEGITEDINPLLDVSISDNVDQGILEEISFSYITKAVTGQDSLTVYCYQKKPDVDLDLMLKISGNAPQA